MAHTCSRDCHFRRMGPSVYVCTTSGYVHRCGRDCTAPKIACQAGEYCSFTGCETYGQNVMHYSNPKSTDGYGRTRGGAHWVKDWSKRGPSVSRPFKLRHPCSKITSVLRNLLCSPQYEAYLQHQRHRRGEYVKAALRKTQGAPFDVISQIHRASLLKFPGASKIQLRGSHVFLTVLASKLATYSTQNPSLQIKSTKAYVGAMLTLMAKGFNSKEGQLICASPKLNNYLPPPNAMTQLGITCRSVSLAVRELKRHLLGSSLNGVLDHAMEQNDPSLSQHKGPRAARGKHQNPGAGIRTGLSSGLSKQEYRRLSCNIQGRQAPL